MQRSELAIPSYPSFQSVASIALQRFSKLSAWLVKSISARINHTCGALEAGTRKDPPLQNLDLIHPSINHRRQTAKEKKGRDEKTGKGGEVQSTEARPAHLWLSTICHSSLLSLKGGSAKGSPREAGEAPNLAKNLPDPRRPATSIHFDQKRFVLAHRSIRGQPAICLATAVCLHRKRANGPPFAVGASCTLPTEHALLHSGHASAGPMHRRPASGRHTQTRLLSWQAVSCREAPVAPRRRQMG